MNSCLVPWSLFLVSVLVTVFLLRRQRQLRIDRDTLLREKDIAFSFVHDVGDVFAEGTQIDQDALLERVLFYAQRTTRAGAGALYLADPDGETLRAGAISGAFPPIVNGLTFDIDNAESKLRAAAKMAREQTARAGEGLIGSVFSDGAAALITNAELDSRIPRFEQEFLTVHSMLLVPMRFQDQIHGVLVVMNRVDDTPFTETDQNLLQALADQASVSIHYMEQSAALDEKRQIDYDLSIARQIQAALLPSGVPAVPGVDAAAFSMPARGIGGDYYDFIAVDENRLGIVVADVSGKGISGALIMSICRSILRSYAPGNPSPAAVLKTANAIISKDLSEDIFISVLYMIFDSKSRELKTARAGHVAPIVFSRNGTSHRLLESTGMALGMAESAVFDKELEEVGTNLKEGETIVAYTDGVTEAMDQDQHEWKTAGLVRSAGATLQAGGSAEDITRNVRTALLEFVGEIPQYDDITLVALRVTPRE